MVVMLAVALASIVFAGLLGFGYARVTDAAAIKRLAYESDQQRRRAWAAEERVKELNSDIARLTESSPPSSKATR